MDPSLVSALAAVASVASVAVAVFVVIRDIRRDKLNTEHQAQWEREQEQKWEERERRQLDAAAPHLRPVGATWDGLNNTPPIRLAADVKQHDIDIHNVGNSTPVGVAAALFGARTKIPQSGTRTDNLFGTYWEGTLDVSPAPNGRARLLLGNRNYPLTGEQNLIHGLTLFAPDEPILSLPQSDPMLYARLTLSYRDAYGRTLVLVYDAEAIVRGRFKIEWRHVAGPVEITKGLQELTDETRRRRDQGENPF
jgi:hypothetical protein